MAAADSIRFWDEQATTFDDEPDHGLRSPRVRDAWRTLLLGALPAPPATVADLGCGTGSLTTLLAERGYTMTGIDTSNAMIDAAKIKVAASDVVVTLEVGDASTPDLAAGGFDAVVVRHVVWALPDPEAAIRRWFECLREGGVAVMIEGRWSTGTGIRADELRTLVSTVASEVEVVPLVDPGLWGRTITDERYLLRAVR